MKAVLAGLGESTKDIFFVGYPGIFLKTLIQHLLSLYCYCHIHPFQLNPLPIIFGYHIDAELFDASEGQFMCVDLGDEFGEGRNRGVLSVGVSHPFELGPNSLLTIRFHYIIIISTSQCLLITPT